MKHVIISENLIFELQKCKDLVYIIKQNSNDENMINKCDVEIDLIDVIMLYINNLIYFGGGSLCMGIAQMNGVKDLSKLISDTL